MAIDMSEQVCLHSEYDSYEKGVKVSNWVRPTKYGDGMTFDELIYEVDPDTDPRIHELIDMLSAMHQSPEPGDAELSVMYSAELIILQAQEVIREERLLNPEAVAAMELWLAMQLDEYELQGTIVDDEMLYECKALAEFIASANPLIDRSGMRHIAEVMYAEIEAQRVLRGAIRTTDYRLAV